MIQESNYRPRRKPSVYNRERVIPSLFEVLITKPDDIEEKIVQEQEQRQWFKEFTEYTYDFALVFQSRRLLKFCFDDLNKAMLFKFRFD
jgi:hypothetical protein